VAGRTNTAEKIIANLKGLQQHLQIDEQPLLALPAIWDNGQQEGHSTACDVVLTNQRILGYYFVSFPRERLFLDTFTLSDITSVSLRQKKFEPLFRELLVSDGERKVYIRAPRQKIEILYAALRSAIADYVPAAQAAFTNEPASDLDLSASQPAPHPTPIYGRQEIRAPFETSILAMTLLFVGGVILEIIGVVLWNFSHSSATGLPLCIAGFLAVLVAIILRRQRVH
jgi:hypothetical protein